MKKLLLGTIKILTKIFPASVFITVYIFLAKIRIIRILLNSIIKHIIPEQTNIPEGTLVLNKKDPVVSGAVTFGVYEKFESELFRQYLKPGMNVVDIGANVGYFTLIAAKNIGPTGRVVAFEPDPENFNCLKKTTELNRFSNVSLHNIALGDKDGDIDLYLSESNMGDHRIYNVKNEQRTKVNAKMLRLDSVEELRQLPVGLVKMDVQGAEGLVLKGMEQFFNNNSKQVIFTEFWPYGLSQTGVSPEVVLENLLKRFNILEIDEKKHRLVPVTDIKLLIAAYQGRKYANLICER